MAWKSDLNKTILHQSVEAAINNLLGSHADRIRSYSLMGYVRDPTERQLQWLVAGYIRENCKTDCHANDILLQIAIEFCNIIVLHEDLKVNAYPSNTDPSSLVKEISGEELKNGMWLMDLKTGLPGTVSSLKLNGKVTILGYTLNMPFLGTTFEIEHKSGDPLLWVKCMENGQCKDDYGMYYMLVDDLACHMKGRVDDDMETRRPFTVSAATNIKLYKKMADYKAKHRRNWKVRGEVLAGPMMTMWHMDGGNQKMKYELIQRVAYSF